MEWFEGNQFSILAWRIPWTEEPSRLQPMGRQRIRHNWDTNTFNSELVGKNCISKVSLILMCLYFLQFSSVAQPCPTLCNPMNHSTPGLPVHHQLPESIQTHVHCVGVQLSHHLSFPSPPAFNLSQHQGLFQWVNSLHQVAKVLEFQLQHQSFQWIFRTDFL